MATLRTKHVPYISRKKETKQKSMTKARSSAEVILSHDFEMCRQRTGRLVERAGGSKD